MYDRFTNWHVSYLRLPSQIQRTNGQLVLPHCSSNLYRIYTLFRKEVSFYYNIIQLVSKYLSPCQVLTWVFVILESSVLIRSPKISVASNEHPFQCRRVITGSSAVQQRTTCDINVYIRQHLQATQWRPFWKTEITVWAAIKTIIKTIQHNVKKDNEMINIK